MHTIPFIPNVINKKTGKKYLFYGYANDYTNDNEGRQFAVYTDGSGGLYVRQRVEFEDKFQSIK